MMEELEPVQGVRQDFLSNQWPSQPCKEWGPLSSYYSGSPEGWAQAGCIPFKCVFFLFPTLQPSPQRRGVLKQVGLVHLQRSDMLPV